MFGPLRDEISDHGRFDSLGSKTGMAEFFLIFFRRTPSVSSKIGISKSTLSNFRRERRLFVARLPEATMLFFFFVLALGRWAARRLSYGATFYGEGETAAPQLFYRGGQPSAPDRVKPETHGFRRVPLSSVTRFMNPKKPEIAWVVGGRHFKLQMYTPSVAQIICH